MLNPAVSELKADLFDPFLGKEFEVRALDDEGLEGPLEPVGDVLTRVKLVEVDRCERLKALENGFDHRPREPFSLLFEQADPLEQRVLKQGHYSLCLPGQAIFRMFVVPIAAQRKKGCPPIASPADYQVVYN